MPACHQTLLAALDAFYPRLGACSAFLCALPPVAASLKAFLHFCAVLRQVLFASLHYFLRVLNLELQLFVHFFNVVELVVELSVFNNLLFLVFKHLHFFPVPVEMKRLSNCITLIAKKLCYHKEIIDQTEMFLFFVPSYFFPPFVLCHLSSPVTSYVMF